MKESAWELMISYSIFFSRRKYQVEVFFLLNKNMISSPKRHNSNVNLYIYYLTDQWS